MALLKSQVRDIKIFNTSNTYRLNDIITYNSLLWEFINTTPSSNTPPHPDWRLVETDSNFEFRENWISPTTAGDFNWTITTALGGTSTMYTPVVGDGNRVGIVSLTLALGLGSIVSYNLYQSGIFAGTSFFCNINIKTPAILASLVEPYIMLIGFNDSTATNEGVDGIYFYYSNANANWICRSRSNSTTTSSTTSTTVAANTWYNLYIYYNNISGQIVFYINSLTTPVATISTNIPNTVSRVLGPTIKLYNSAINLTAKSMLVDKYYLIIP